MRNGLLTFGGGFLAAALLLAGPWAHAKEPADEKAPATKAKAEHKPAIGRLFVALYGQGPKWVEGKRIIEQPGIDDHVDYMVTMYKADQLRLAGPYLDTPGGMVIFAAKDEAAAKQILAKDPAITGGLLTAKLHTWYSVDWPNYKPRK